MQDRGLIDQKMSINFWWFLVSVWKTVRIITFDTLFFWSPEIACCLVVPDKRTLNSFRCFSLHTHTRKVFESEAYLGGFILRVYFEFIRILTSRKNRKREHKFRNYVHAICKTSIKYWSKHSYLINSNANIHICFIQIS